MAANRDEIPGLNTRATAVAMIGVLLYPASSEAGVSVTISDGRMCGSFHRSCNTLLGDK